MLEPTRLVPGMFWGAGWGALALWDLLFRDTSLFMGALTSRPNYYTKTPSLQTSGLGIRDFSL